MSKQLFQKGKVKSGGRIKGTPNKETARIRNAFSDLLESNLGNIEKDLGKLKPKERLNILIKIADFCILQLQSIDSSINMGPMKIIVRDGTKNGII